MGAQFLQVDYSNPEHAHAIVALLDHYAQSPVGGGTGLSEYVKRHVVSELSKRPHAFSVLAYVDGEAVGLANCFLGFSTFACANLVNVHDLVVREPHRRQGVGTGLLAYIEKLALAHGACKLTLEVLQHNEPARRAYARFGFGSYTLEPAYGPALFLEKRLGDSAH